MGNYTICSKILGERQASKKFYNEFSENSRSQIVFGTDIFRKLTLGAPVWSDFGTALIQTPNFSCTEPNP